MARTAKDPQLLQSTDNGFDARKAIRIRQWGIGEDLTDFMQRLIAAVMYQRSVYFRKPGKALFFVFLHDFLIEFQTFTSACHNIVAYRPPRCHKIVASW